MIDKYIALRNEYTEKINWSAGMRKGGQIKDLPVYVTLESDGLRHTLIGTDIDVLLEQCYNEFIEGDRNGVKEYEK